MREWTYGFKIDTNKCRGSLNCMRICPTQAIRVRSGKAELLHDLCIDCGYCLRVCPTGAIFATTCAMNEFTDFIYRVAVPSPVLFGQFPANISPAHIVHGLKSLGFNDVWIMAPEIELANRAIRDYMKNWKGRLPLISSACPPVVRLIQVSYPDMVEQLVHIEPPRELAGMELKRRYSQELGIPVEKIAAVYVTSCQAKTISILEPAEGGKSYLNGAIGITDVYNGILSSVQSGKEIGCPDTPAADILRSREIFQWDMSEGQRWNLKGYRYMSLTGLSNIIQVLDDIEKGKLRNVDFLECYACWGGCINGNLTVDNLYITRSKMQRLMAELPERDLLLEEEVEKRYNINHLSAKAPIRPRFIKDNLVDMKERIRRIREEEAVLATLPGMNCGLCGAPNCKTQARDIAAGNARKSDCVFHSRDRLDRLREIYLKKKE